MSGRGFRNSNIIVKIQKINAVWIISVSVILNYKEWRDFLFFFCFIQKCDKVFFHTSMKQKKKKKISHKSIPCWYRAVYYTIRHRVFIFENKLFIFDLYLFWCEWVSRHLPSLKFCRLVWRLPTITQPRVLTTPKEYACWKHYGKRRKCW